MKTLDPSSSPYTTDFAKIRERGMVTAPMLLLLVFVFTVLAWNWPVLSIAEQSGGVTLFVYLFTIWPLIIVLLWLAGRMLNKPDSNG